VDEYLAPKRIESRIYAFSLMVKWLVKICQCKFDCIGKLYEFNNFILLYKFMQ
jgi:hypothetical protein